MDKSLNLSGLLFTSQVAGGVKSPPSEDRENAESGPQASCILSTC